MANVHPAMLAAAMATASGIAAPGEAVTTRAVFEVCSLILYGKHAIPIQLKIPLDILFQSLSEDEVNKILKGYGWTMEDYQRGYILKVKLIHFFH